VVLGNAWLTFRGRRPWTTRLWSVVLVLALGVVAWVGVAFHLIGFTTRY
jgi:hypothetical protein